MAARIRAGARRAGVCEDDTGTPARRRWQGDGAAALLCSDAAASAWHRLSCQDLLRRVNIRPAQDLTARFPAECPVRIRVHVADGTHTAIENASYEGYFNQPMSWPAVIGKFERLVDDRLSQAEQANLIARVETLDSLESIRSLTALLGA